MNDGQLNRRLIERNPWWREPERWELDDQDLRSLRGAPFEYQPVPLSGVQADGLYLLLGPRRVGKSVEIKRTIASLIRSGVDPRRITFLACDGLRQNDLVRSLHLGRNLSRTLTGARYWFLDEVTSVAGWSEIIKGERDATALRDDSVVLSGSSSRDLQESTVDFAGRRGEMLDTERILLPMGFRPFCAAIGLTGIPAPDPLRPRDVFSSKALLDEMMVYWPQLSDAWTTYLLVGGYPKAVRTYVETGAVASSFVRDLWDVVRGDAFRTFEMTDPETTALLGRLTLSLTSTINLSDVARDLGLADHRRVDARISALTRSFLGLRTYQDDGGRPRMDAMRKFYFTDPLLARLAHAVDDGYPEPDDSKVSEQQVAVALTRAIERERTGSVVGSTEVRFYRNDKSAAEVDFVGARVGTGVEGKYIDGSWRGDAKTLLAQGPGGIMVTRGVFDTSGDDAIAVPAGLYAWLIDG